MARRHSRRRRNPSLPLPSLPLVLVGLGVAAVGYYFYLSSNQTSAAASFKAQPPGRAQLQLSKSFTPAVGNRPNLMAGVI